MTNRVHAIVRVPGVLLLGTLFWACGAPEAERAVGLVVSDSAGIRIVDNGPLDPEPILLARAEPVLRIGVVEGPPEFQLFRVSDAKRLLDGGVAVANAGSRELRIYNSDGSHRATAGGAGRGPSEFQYPAALIVLPGDTIQVQDLLDRVYFTADGTFVRRETMDRGASASPVAIVTARAARTWWPGADAPGRQIKLGQDGAWMTVVGVVEDLRQLDELGRSVAIRSTPPTPLVFLPYGQLQGTPTGWRSFDCCAGVRIGARIVDDPAPVIRTARSIVAQEAPGLPLVSSATLHDVQTRGYVGSSMATTGRLVSLGMLVALLLALGGIVGIVSEAVGRRHREIGVRVALGAGRARVLWTVGKESVVTTLAGLVAGLGALVALETWLSRVVLDYYVRQLAPEVLSAPVLGTASAVVLVTALVAVLATARRATRVNPSEVLRSE